MIDDPIGLALVQKQLDHIARQMGWVMMRTARSPIFSQSHDFSCFIGDGDGNVVSQVDGLPIHTGGGSFAIKAVLSACKGEIADGDVYISSDPYEAGGNHLPDWTIIRPVFVRDQLLAFCCNRAHQSDIGGGAAGTYNAAATEIFHEGIRLPVLRLIDAGRLRQDLWRLLLLNSRCPDLLDGDLLAMLGSTEIGAKRVAEALSNLPDASTARHYLAGILDHAERLMRDDVRQLAGGVYEGEDESDNDCFGPADIRVRVRITVSMDGIHVDFTGSSPQIKGFKNSSLANTHSSVYLAILAFLGSGVPKNDGAFRPITILAPQGTIVNARGPAPMTMNTVYPATNIVHACWKALAACDPKRACAGWGKALHCVTSGPTPKGNTFVMYHWHGLPAAGAVQGRDGFPTMGTVPTLCGLRLANVEAYEQLYPVRIHQYEMRCDAAGAGEFRGGTGVDYVADVDVAADYSFRGEGAHGLTAFGVNGGRAGQTGSLSLATPEGAPIEAPQFGVRHLPPLRITIASPGGGGFGDPLRRDPEAVLRDVADGVVSVRKARETYGVGLIDNPLRIDTAATAALRNEAMPS
jgi:N-methylhydantoinase B